MKRWPSVNEVLKWNSRSFALDDDLDDSEEIEGGGGGGSEGEEKEVFETSSLPRVDETAADVIIVVVFVTGVSTESNDALRDSPGLFSLSYV